MKNITIYAHKVCAHSYSLGLAVPSMNAGVQGVTAGETALLTLGKEVA